MTTPAPKSVSLAVIGGGSMGSAFVDGALQASFLDPSRVQIYERDTGRHGSFDGRGIKCFAGPDPALERADLVLLAVKPQVAEEVCAHYRPFLVPGQLVLSIMAGTPVASLQRWLGSEVRVVRCMPNLPVLALRGVSVYWKDPSLDSVSISLVEGLLNSVGVCIGVDSETLVDAATAISGSGPGYLFFISEALCNVARTLGFSEEQAHILVQHTVLGTGELWSMKGGAPGDWRRQVTSKGGTTEACLSHLTEHHLQKIFMKGVEKAFHRARELSGGSEKG